MDWDKVRIFHAVADAGSFTGAGNTLNSSQSAISRQISSLEDSLGVPLFHRHARGLILTEQGEILYKATHDVTKKLSRAQSQIKASKSMDKGPLVVTVAHFIGATWLAPRLAEFRRQHPNIKLTLIFDNRAFNLSMREADCAIRLKKPDHQDLIQRQLRRISFHICASPEYLNTHGMPHSETDLKNHCLFAYPKPQFAPFDSPNWLLDRAGVSLEADNVYLVNSMHAMLSAVETGAGIAALPDFLTEDNPNCKIILPHLNRPDVEMFFVYPEEHRNSVRIQAFRDFLLENIHKN